MEYEDLDLFSSGSGLGETNYSRNLSCAARILRAALNNSSLPAPVGIASRVFHVVYFSIVMVVGTFLNVLIIFLAARFKKLRTRSFSVAVQISIANLGWILCFGLPAVIQHSYGRQVFSVELCIASGYFMHVLMDVRIILLFLFSLERFASVFAPFTYPKHSLWVTVLTSVLAWLITSICILMALPQILDCFSYSTSTFNCPFFSTTCSKHCTIYTMGYIIFVPMPCMVLSIVFYTTLYKKAMKIRRTDSDLAGMSHQKMITNDWKIYKTFALIVITLLVINVMLVLLRIASQLRNSTAKTILTQLTIDILILFTISDPFLLMRNPDVREAKKTLIKSVFHKA